MTRTIINISKRYSLDVVTFVKRISQVLILSLTVTLLLSPPSESLDIGVFLALLAQRLFGVALTSVEGAAAVAVMLGSVFGAYKIYPVLSAVEGFDEGDLNAYEFGEQISKEQGQLRVFGAVAIATGAGYLLTSLGAETTALDMMGAAFIGVGLLALITLVYATYKVARCGVTGVGGYVGLAQGAFAKRGRLAAPDMAKLLILATLR